MTAPPRSTPPGSEPPSTAPPSTALPSTALPSTAPAPRIQPSRAPSSRAQLGSLTTADVDGEQSLLIVPLGSTEQHGPHLPLATDSLIAEAWAVAIADELDAAGTSTAVAPVLPYGSAGEHQSFPGTLSIGQDALVHVLVELARSATTHHRGVLFVSGHAGNAVPLERAVQQLRTEGHRVEAALPVLADSDAHAGRTETSLLLHLAPDLVRLQRAEAGATAPISELIDALRSGGVAAVSANGVLGDPAGASAVEGAELFAQLTHLGVQRASLLR